MIEHAREDAEELRILLADDNESTRLGIKLAVKAHGIRVVAETSDAADALTAALAHRPDVCVLSARLPGDGIEASRLIKQAMPEIRIMMMTDSERSDELFGALRAGVDGYLLMSTSPDRLPHAIRGVAKGEAALPRQLTARLIEEFREHGNRRRLSLPAGTHGVELTSREFDVLERLRRREGTSEVAATLGISEITVRRHISAIVRKLGLPNRNSLLELLEQGESS